MHGTGKSACERLTEAGKPHPTPFEIETALAFLYFAKQNCELVVLETGMGGATDATNLILSPVCSVLTDISRDHMGFLGDTLAEIAGVKAGIIKKGRSVVTVRQAPEAMKAIEKQARELGSKLIVADEKRIHQISYDADGMELVCAGYHSEGTFYEEERKPDETGELRLKLSLTGAHQAHNALLSLTVAETLRGLGYRVTERHILSGFENVRWQGRFETIHREPRIVIDGAHNEGAAEKLRDTIENCFTNQPITYIIGVLADKEHEKMLKLLLPCAKKVYTVTPDNPRALPGEVLCREAGKYHPNVVCEEEIRDAVEHAAADAGRDGVVIAFGSLSYLKQVKEAVRQL